MYVLRACATVIDAAADAQIRRARLKVFVQQLHGWPGVQRLPD
jgi:hypothetical protein